MTEKFEKKILHYWIQKKGREGIYISGSNKLLTYLKLTLLPQLIQLILLLLITTNFCYYGKLYLNTPLKMEINEYYEVPFCQGQKQMELEKEALLAYLPHEESSNNHFGVFPS